jgi:hypothetical protein
MGPEDAVGDQDAEGALHKSDAELCVSCHLSDGEQLNYKTLIVCRLGLGFVGWLVGERAASE